MMHHMYIICTSYVWHIYVQEGLFQLKCKGYGVHCIKRGFQAELERHVKGGS